MKKNNFTKYTILKQNGKLRLSQKSNLITVPVPALAVEGAPLFYMNELKIAFSNPKADILLYHGDSTMDN